MFTQGIKKASLCHNTSSSLPSYLQRQFICDRNSSRSQVPRELTVFFPPLQTSVNVYPPIYRHSALDASTRSIRFQRALQMKNRLLSSSRGDCWPSLKLVMCAKVRHPQLLFVHKLPKGIFDSGVYTAVWSLRAFVFGSGLVFLFFIAAGSLWKDKRKAFQKNTKLYILHYSALNSALG